MGGAETLRRLLEMDPGAKAVVCSGYAADGVIADYRRHGFKAALAKPYTLAGLRDVLAGLLGRVSPLSSGKGGAGTIAPWPS